MSNQVEVTDVFLRDGLQDEPVVVATADKLRIAEALRRAGFRRIEAASFVNPKRVPQMADAEAVFASRPEGGPSWSALALNGRGIARALDAGARDIQIVASASAAHSAANAGRSTEQALEELREQVAAARAEHPDVRFHAGVSTAFTCPYEGEVPKERLLGIVDRFAAMGVHELGLADTLGNTPPERVMESVEHVRRAHPELRYSLHLHNAHGRALETVTAAVEAGITRFDAALGGYGGCPFAPGAAGNLASHALVAHLHSLGAETGIDEQLLAEATSLARAAVAAATPVPTTAPKGARR
ncbi:hydroxymethylglutaryl-CoA lyase [Gulosibacter sp. 10]|uniref:hydroxymethylglutaryl-CoA lyase n=1 Tax=Gulosibacter sp. 10 TaxID=1255570 RepID=UPI0020CFA1BF|nr:hydroxymethylglutaryl-CoA lyase [Gulosibacter sp. 10]